MANPLRRFLDPHVEEYLIDDEGEEIIDEVMRHWVVVIGPTCLVLLGIVLFLLMPALGLLWPLAMVVGLALVLYGIYRIQREYMDRFVITNMRVFRVHGLFNQQTATVPMSRILDVSVQKPLIGRMLGFGHFVFESAAQEQGLREILFVGRPDERDLTIQRVIQRSGLRQNFRVVRTPEYDPRYDD